MIEQFEHHSRKYGVVDLAPLGGQASNPNKYELAREIDSLAVRYPNSTIAVLYFGDYDEHGIQIPQTALGDVETWAEEEFVSYRIGLNSSPPSQWEALEDDEVGEIITTAIEHFLDTAKFDAWREIEHKASKAVNDIIKEHCDFEAMKEAFKELLNEWNK